MRLYLVRHAAVTVRPEQLPEQWHLSAAGRAGAEALAEQSIWEGLAATHTSPEPKAVATAQRIAAQHGLPIVIARGLREVGGRTYTAPDQHRELVRRYLAGEVVDSWERRDVALERVRSSIERIAAAGKDDVAVVSHGLVLTLYVSELLGLGGAAADELQARLRLPDLAIIDPQARRVERNFGE